MSNIRLHIQGRTIELVPAEANPSILIPTHLLSQSPNWIKILDPIQKLVGDRLLVTSIKDDLEGNVRSGSSHPNGWACDFTLPDRWKGPDDNPRYDNDIRLLMSLSALHINNVMIVAESDHFHLEASNILPGTYIYSYQRPEFYLSDRLPQHRTIPDRTLITVRPTSVFVEKDIMDKMLNQRKITESRAFM